MDIIVEVDPKHPYLPLLEYLADLFESIVIERTVKNRLPWNINLWWLVFISVTEVILFDAVKQALRNTRRYPPDKKNLFLKTHHAAKPDKRSDSTVTAHQLSGRVLLAR